MNERKGFAVAAALLALMLIAALVASVFFAAMEETRIGAAGAGKQLALMAAESAIESTIAAWPGDTTDPIGIPGVRSRTIDQTGTAVTITMTRLDSTIYWIVALAASASSQPVAARRIGALVRVRTAPDRSIIIERLSERWWSELF